MAHFAEIDKNKKVTRVIVLRNEDCQDPQGHENEQVGIDFLKNLLGKTKTFVQTSYNATIRKNYAGPGFTFDAERNAFIPPKPTGDFVLNETTCKWEPASK